MASDVKISAHLDFADPVAPLSRLYYRDLLAVDILDISKVLEEGMGVASNDQIHIADLWNEPHISLIALVG